MELVTIEIAKKLKTKEFPQGNEDDITRLYYQISDNLQSAIMLSEGKDVKWYCPSISEVLKWLRDEKNLFVYPSTVQLPEDERLGEHSGKRMWDFSVDDLNIDDCIFESRLKYHSYEEAAMAGIEWVLDYILL